ncbi:MAG: DNA-3-methyladenine glycosylase [Bacteroidales bacterium]
MKKATDPVIVGLQQKFQLPELPVSADLYLDMVENIVSQQLSGRVARVIFQRFQGIFPNNYPSPDLLLSTPDALLRNTGLSGSKTRYVKALAEFALHNDLSIKTIQAMSDEELVLLLTQVKGVGVWTVQMLLIFSLNRQDVFPVDDLAIQQGMKEVYGVELTGKPLKEKLISISNKWQPHRTLGTRLIWAYMNDKKQNATRR